MTFARILKQTLNTKNDFSLTLDTCQRVDGPHNLFHLCVTQEGMGPGVSLVVIIIIIIWCFILCERQFFYKNSLAPRTNQNKSHNITIYILH